MEVSLHVDGGARGNPGPAGAGVVLRQVDGPRLYEGGYFLGHATNNVAEYTALVRGLRRAQQIAGLKHLTIYSDSELLVKQITGQYRVKSPGLIGLFEQAQVLLLKIARWTIRHVPREANTRADELANMAMDQRRDVVVFDVSGGTTADAATPESEDVPADAEVDDADVDEADDERDVDSPASAEAAPASNHRPGVRVTVSHPAGAACPAGGVPKVFTVTTTLPAALCLHAAHALLPTVLAIMNTAPDEFAAIPTMTVRCGRAECGAVFQVSPLRGANGRAH